MYSVERSHSACIAHRLLGHQGKCRFVHGHNYVFTVRLESPYLNSLEMVMDFSDIKTFWDKWIDENWDHSIILNKADPLLGYFRKASKNSPVLSEILGDRVIAFDGNPTAERMAEYLAKLVRDYLWRNNVLSKIYTIIISVEETAGNTARFVEVVQGE